MSEVVACSAATSLLPTLEPLVGVAIAINLAYLNLSKFAYIDRIKDIIKDRIGKIDANVLESVQDTAWCRQLNSLASVRTIDNRLHDSQKTLWIDAPKIWGFLYNVLFYWRVGRAGAIAATIYSIYLLVLGVGHSSGVLKWSACNFDKDHLLDNYIWATVSLVWPMLVVIAGQIVGWRASAFITYQTNHLKQEARQDNSAAIQEAQAALSKAGTASPGLNGPVKPTTPRRKKGANDPKPSE